MNSVLLRDNHITFTVQSELCKSDKKITIDVSKLGLNDELQKELINLFVLYETSIYINLKNVTTNLAVKIIDETEELPGGLQQINKLNQFRRKFKNTLSSPVFIVKKKQALAQCLNNENKFMEKIFGTDWKKVTIVEQYLPHISYIYYSSKALLFIYQYIIPNIHYILSTINEDAIIKKLIDHLENEKISVEHAMLARIKNGINKKELVNDDVFYYITEELADKNEMFNKHYELAQKFGCFSAPEKKMVEDDWILINQNLSKSSNEVIKKAYTELWENQDNWQMVKFKVIKRSYGLVVIPSDIKAELIPLKIPQLSWLHPGITKRCHFFADNFYKIADINLKITNLKQNLENLNAPLSHRQILSIFKEIFLIEDIFNILKINAETNKFRGIKRFFFKATNNMLDNWKTSVINIQNSVFLPLKAKFIQILMAHNPNIDWIQATNETILLQMLRDQTYRLETTQIISNLITLTENEDSIAIFKCLKELVLLKKTHQEEIEYTKSFQDVIDQYFNWIFQRIIGNTLSEDKISYSEALLENLLKELPQCTTKLFNNLTPSQELNFGRLKDIISIRPYIKFYLNKRILKFDIDESVVKCLRLLSKEQLRQIEDDIILLLPEIDENDPIRMLLGIIHKVVSNINNGIEYQLNEEEWKYVRFFATFKKLIHYLIDNVCIPNQSDNVLDAGTIKQFYESPYSNYVTFWQQLINTLNPYAPSNKLEWLTINYSKDDKKDYREILIQKFIGCSLIPKEIQQLWEKLLTYDQAYMYIDESENYLNVVNELTEFVAEFHAICAGRLNAFNFLLKIENTNLQDFDLFLNSLSTSDSGGMFQFFNANPDCPGNLIDALLIKYIKCLDHKKHDIKYLLNKIDALISSYANSEQKEIYLQLINGKNLEVEIVTRLYENYYRAIFKINSIKFINFLNNSKLIKKSAPNLWEASTKELPILLKKKLIYKILKCQLVLCDTQMTETANEIINRCWESIAQDLKSESRCIQKIVNQFLADHCLLASFKPESSANSNTIAFVINGATA